MAGSSTIGALRVVLGADTAAFSKGLKDADSSLGSFGKKAAVAGAAIATAMVAVGTALGVAVGRTLTQMDELGKTAQKIGIPVEELSKLKYAADLSGVSMELLSVGVAKLSKNMVDATTNAAGPMGQAFKALGVSVTETDGTLKSSSTVLTEIAGKFANMEDGAGKTALAMELFGKSGKELIPLLNAGATGLASMFVEAEKLGLVFDTKTAKAAETFNDALTTLSRVWDGFLIQVTSAVAGPLADLATALKNSAVESGGLKTAGQLVGDAFVDLAFKVLKATGEIRAFAVAMGGALEAAAQFTSLDWTAGNQTLAQTKEAIAAIRQETADFLFNMKAAAADREFLAMLGSIPGATAPAITSQQQLAAAAKEAAASFKYQQEIQTQGLAVWESTLTGAEKLDLELIKLRILHDQLGASSFDLAKAEQQAAEQASNTWAQAGGSIAGSFATIAGSFGKSNSKMAIAAKAFAIVQAVISVYQGMAKALTLPFPANLAAAAAVAAQGFAFVAQIRSQQIPSFAHGGSFTVGGMGGVDSNLFAMNLTKGERVDVTPAGKSERPAPVNLTLVGDQFGRNQVIRLAHELIELQRDGFKLMVT